MTSARTSAMPFFSEVPADDFVSFLRTNNWSSLEGVFAVAGVTSIDALESYCQRTPARDLQAITGLTPIQARKLTDMMTNRNHPKSPSHMRSTNGRSPSHAEKKKSFLESEKDAYIARLAERSGLPTVPEGPKFNTTTLAIKNPTIKSYTTPTDLPQAELEAKMQWDGGVRRGLHATLTKARADYEMRPSLMTKPEEINLRTEFRAARKPTLSPTDYEARMLLTSKLELKQFDKSRRNDLSNLLQREAAEFKARREAPQRAEAKAAAEAQLRALHEGDAKAGAQAAERWAVQAAAEKERLHAEEVAKAAAEGRLPYETPAQLRLRKARESHAAEARAAALARTDKTLLGFESRAAELSAAAAAQASNRAASPPASPVSPEARRTATEAREAAFEAEEASLARQAAVEAEAARARQAAVEAEEAARARQAAVEAEAARVRQAAVEAEAARARQAAVEAEEAARARQAAVEAEEAARARQAAVEAEAARARQAAVEAEEAARARQAAVQELENALEASVEGLEESRPLHARAEALGRALTAFKGAFEKACEGESPGGGGGEFAGPRRSPWRRVPAAVRAEAAVAALWSEQSALASRLHELTTAAVRSSCAPGGGASGQEDQEQQQRLKLEREVGELSDALRAAVELAERHLAPARRKSCVASAQARVQALENQRKSLEAARLSAAASRAHTETEEAVQAKLHEGAAADHAAEQLKKSHAINVENEIKSEARQQPEGETMKQVELRILIRPQSEEKKTLRATEVPVVEQVTAEGSPVDLDEAQKQLMLEEQTQAATEFDMTSTLGNASERRLYVGDPAVGYFPADGNWYDCEILKVKTQGAESVYDVMFLGFDLNEALEYDKSIDELATIDDMDSPFGAELRARASSRYLQVPTEQASSPAAAVTLEVTAEPTGKNPAVATTTTTRKSFGAAGFTKALFSSLFKSPAVTSKGAAVGSKAVSVATAAAAAAAAAAPAAAPAPAAAVDPTAQLLGVSERQGRRQTMEDRWAFAPFLLGPGTWFAAVFDGHGGDQASAFLHDRLSAAIAEALPPANVLASTGRTLDDETVRVALQAAFSATDAALLRELPPSCDAGSTATTVLRLGRRLVCANTGDSRSVLCREDGAGGITVVALSDDHKPSKPDEKARIMKRGGLVLKNRLQLEEGTLGVSRAFGDRLAKRSVREIEGDAYEEDSDIDGDLPVLTAEPEVRVVDLSDPRFSGELFVLLACDGLWDVFENLEACAFLVRELRSNGGSPSRALEALTDEAIVKRGSTDNVTAIMVLLQPMQRITAVQDAR